MIKIFYCNICKDKLPRFRYNYRKHLKTHIRNELMCNDFRGKGSMKNPKRQDWVIEEIWN